MRKSAAPSRLSHFQDTLSSNLNSLRTVDNKSVSLHSLNPQINNTSINSDISQSTKCLRFFEAVYAKASVKKHKKWEGDGFVEVDGRTIKLTDEGLKVIASTSGHKLTFLNEINVGSIVHIGHYEAELISQIKKPQSVEFASKSKTTSEALDMPIKNSTSKRNAQSSFPPKPNFISNLNESSGSSNQLIMPKPPASCIWSQNSDNLPIVDVVLESKFASRLHPHQREGIIFLYKCLMGFQPYVGLDDSTSHSIHGCILADEMGLGKTVQAIATIWLLIKQGPYGGRPIIRRCLIVTPGTLVQNWLKEFSKWLGREQLPVYCVDQNHSIKHYLTMATNSPQVVLMSYEMFLQHTSEVYTISDLDMVVCDEGHRLKNSNINTTMALCQLRACRRLLLTGTPLQNHLDELWSLANFCVPGRLTSSLEEFRRQFVIPLLNSRKVQNEKCNNHNAINDDDDGDYNFWNHTDSENSDDLESPSAKLFRLLNSFFLRRTSDVIAPKLTDKTEHILFCRPSKLQTDLTHILTQWMNNEFHLNRSESLNLLKNDDYTEDFVESMEEVLSSPSKHHNSILPIITAFRKLHNHPYLLRNYLLQSDSTQYQSVGHLPEKLTADLLRLLNSDHSVVAQGLCHTNLNEFIQLSGKFNVLYIMLKRLFNKQQSSSTPNDTVNFQKKPRLSNGGSKNLHTNDRLVLVSNFTQTLDLLEKLCNLVTGHSSLRLDGQTTNKKRAEIVQRINDPKSHDRILLLSSRAGGVGLNLIGANYLILFDMDWNPANDAQAMARIWRPGQSRPVNLYRLVTSGGMEERIFQRQAAKLALTSQTLVNTSVHNGNLFNFIEKKKPEKNTGILTRDELKELFLLPDTSTSSWTHDLIQCNCHQSEEERDLTPSPSISSSSDNEAADQIAVSISQVDSLEFDNKENIEERKTFKRSVTFTSEDDDEYSNIRIFQLGSTNPITINNTESHQSTSKSITSSKLSSSDSLGFLLNWKHSLSSEQICQLNDRLLITHQLDPMKSLLNCVFTLNSKAS
ncbi:DNA repair and recombination protein RAD54B [Schistosoma japonicum]|nr:DNA repair and recombination protein RAD54B [Schistosoma japonicum]